jgi:tetratricopeptide (TPR) repeat protein
MRCWIGLYLLLGLSAALCAQQGSDTDADAGKSSQSKSSESNPSEQKAGEKPVPSKAAPNSTQPPADGLSRDLTFPEADPSESPAPAHPAKTSRMAPPRSDRVQADDLGPGSGVSSSKDTQVDLNPPEDDSKAHPQSSTAMAAAEAEVSGGVSEFKTWDPHKAAKSIEVGDFYFKRKNYRAAEDRYREALRYKDNDAVATIRLAVCLEKLGVLDDARAEYESYLKILPHGPQAAEAQAAIERLKVQTGTNK